MSTRKIRLSFSDKVFYFIDYLLLVFCAVIVLIPLLHVVAQSFSHRQAVLAGRVFIWPLSPTLDTYKLILSNKFIVTGYMNTFFYMGAGTCINLFLTILAAYPLSRKEFAGRGIFMLFFAFTMLFSGGMIPTYLVVRDLGLIDTRWAMLLPGALAVWNVILARTFFQTSIPSELYESAELDGAGDTTVLLRIVLPLSPSILAVLTLFYAIGHWNSYFDAMLYLRSTSLYNIQTILRIAIANISQIMNQTGGNMQVQEEALAWAEASKYVIIVISMVPVLIIYPFVQKHFVKGIMIGAIKG